MASVKPHKHEKQSPFPSRPNRGGSKARKLKQRDKKIYRGRPQMSRTLSMPNSAHRDGGQSLLSVQLLCHKLPVIPNKEIKKLIVKLKEMNIL